MKNRPFDISRRGDDTWPVRWKPEGDGFDREPFDRWWRRHGNDFAHLHPQIVEQWIFRHWGLTPYGFIDPSKLSWSREEWTAEKIEHDVWGDDHREADWDYRCLLETDTGRPFQRDGTWDYPIVVYATPHGIRLRERWEAHPFLLIEGHLRTRFLSACAELGKPINDAHAVYVLRKSEGLPAI